MLTVLKNKRKSWKGFPKKWSRNTVRGFGEEMNRNSQVVLACKCIFSHMGREMDDDFLEYVEN